jgi:5-methylcytosine-specific restriction endonuclease McrA
MGGRHEMKNLRVLCKTCNLKRPKDGRDNHNR